MRKHRKRADKSGLCGRVVEERRSALSLLLLLPFLPTEIMYYDPSLYGELCCYFAINRLIYAKSCHEYFLLVRGLVGLFGGEQVSVCLLLVTFS